MSLLLLAIAQSLLAVRVVLRLIRTAHGPGATPVSTSAGPAGDVTILVPVLDEADRLAPCLDGLIAQGEDVGTIVIVDGGSRDGTVQLAREFASRDARIRIVDATPVPDDWNGKAWNLQRGLEAVTEPTTWILTIDADVRPKPGLASALIQRAATEDLAVLSGATRQRLSGAGEALLHPAMLTSLVYRYGIPGTGTTDPDEVQANGQCMLIRRDALAAIDGFTAARHSICEDVTVARRIAIAGRRVGSAETGDLVDVEMYRGMRDAWRNWPRSLTMRDHYAGHAVAIRLTEVLLVQGFPLIVTIGGVVGRRRHGYPNAQRLDSGQSSWRSSGAVQFILGINRLLVLLRAGVLIGMSRAYAHPPLTYWLSPILDLPVALRLIQSASRRTHVWRGRSLTRG